MESKQPEQVLGRRIVNYLKNEATIGRITKQRLQYLASTLGVLPQVRAELGQLEDGDTGAGRGAAMAQLLAHWAQLPSSHHHQDPGLGLATALEAAKLGYHASEVRAMAASAGGGVVTKQPLILHTPLPSRTASPQKLPALKDEGDAASRTEKGGHSNSDSGVFTSESSKENEEREEKKQGKKMKRVLRRKPISYRVKKKSEPDEAALTSTDTSLELKAESPERLPPVNKNNKNHKKNLLQISEKPEFVSPRAPQKLPSINSHSRANKKGQHDRKLKRKKSVDEKASESEKEQRVKENNKPALKPPNRQRPRVVDRRSHSEDVTRSRHSLRKQRTEPSTAASASDAVVVEVSRAHSDTVISRLDRRRPGRAHRGSSLSDDLVTRSASTRSLRSSRPVLSSKLGKKRLEDAVPETGEQEDKHRLTLLKLDETFTKDDFGNKTFPALTSSSPRDLARTRSRLSPKPSRSRQSSVPASDEGIAADIIRTTISDILDRSETVNCEAHPDFIHKRIESGDNYIKSLCYSDEWFRQNYIAAMALFGPTLKINTRSQAMVWIILLRLAQYWSRNKKHPPTEEQLLEDRDTIRFLLKICRLCLNLIKTDQEQVTAVQEVKVGDDGSETLLKFAQFDVTVPRLRLENFEICVFQDKNTFADPLGHFVECRFEDRPMVEFLAAICIHVYDEDIPEISPVEAAAFLPQLCGISSVAKDKEQNLVINFIEKISNVSYVPIRKESEFYLHKRQLLDVWINDPSPLPLFLSVYEARMKNVHDKHPLAESELNFIDTNLCDHDLIAIAYYLNHVDKKHIKITSFVAKGCGLNDSSLKSFSNKLVMFKTVNLSQNKFTDVGIGNLVDMIGGQDVRMEVLDLSDCDLNNGALEKLAPVVDVVKELSLADNNFTSQGIKKFADFFTKSEKRKLVRLDLSRCNIAKTGFYELIPVLIRTESIVFQGHGLSPLELKEFASKVTELEARGIKSLDISSNSLTDESMPQLAQFITCLESVDLHNSDFSVQSMRILANTIQDNGIGKLKSLNLRLCKLNDDSLEVLSEIIPRISSVTLSSNNFSGITAVKNLCSKIENSDKLSLKFLDLKYSRLAQEMKKSLGEVCKKLNIDLKVW